MTMTRKEYDAKMQPYRDRFWWNMHHLFSVEINPYVAKGEGDALPKNRTGMEDLFHSIKNLWVESGRLKKQAEKDRETQA